MLCTDICVYSQIFTFSLCMFCHPINLTSAFHWIVVSTSLNSTSALCRNCNLHKWEVFTIYVFFNQYGLTRRWDKFVRYIQSFPTLPLMMETDQVTQVLVFKLSFRCTLSLKILMHSFSVRALHLILMVYFQCFSLLTLTWASLMIL